MGDPVQGNIWFTPSLNNPFPALGPVKETYLELDFDLLTKSDIEWISKHCPYILIDLECAPPSFQYHKSNRASQEPPSIRIHSYADTVQQYSKPKIIKKAPRKNHWNHRS